MTAAVSLAEMTRVRSWLVRESEASLTAADPSARRVERSVGLVILVTFGLAVRPNNLPGPITEVPLKKGGPWGEDPRAVQSIWQGEEIPPGRTRGQKWRPRQVHMLYALSPCEVWSRPWRSSSAVGRSPKTSLIA